MTDHNQPLRKLHLDVDPDTRPVPANWTPDCDNCRWHMDECDDLYLFQSVFDRQWHVNGTPRERVSNAT